MLGLPSRAGASDSQALPLWPGMPPGGGGPSGPVRVSSRGAWSNIALPSLQLYRPDKPNGAAMLVAAGGGYKRIEMGSEAHPAAAWLAARGVTAFVLAYRLPEEGWKAGPLAPLQDAQRAMRLIRAGATGYGIDPGRLGVLGFSAGGHLLGLASARSAFKAYPGVDEADTQSARPDNAALIYPIITLEPPYDHTSTRRVLIGRHPSAGESAEWSVQTHVRKDCPPMFLAQAQDDPVSNPANTAIMAQTCQAAGVPVELMRLASGGHGFGMGRPGTPTAAWPDHYEAWLRQRGMLG
ncbi:hypothetical protein GCM10007874_25350 [Labrys miyagiensis]|uniref:BD-FAE-like domain-containing protein n=1 Tax=Labrys miyagiensis TaxID=346912 RepID=A0ABQ6CGP7_9HYPH|nr:alpha/beta hydrolase [Labrys miyagiensis]GLS19518.1 hypothetical protein GCM10007874_25350 [Labrys miyagiensis]